MLCALQDRHQADDVVVVLDAGMLSATNLNAIEETVFGFIVGSRTSKAPHELAEPLRPTRVVPHDGEAMESKPVMAVGVNARERRVGYRYSVNRDRRDNHTLDSSRTGREARPRPHLLLRRRRIGVMLCS